MLTVYRWIKHAGKKGLFSLKYKNGWGVKYILKTKQLPNLRKAISEPTPAYAGYYRGWQTKDTVQFVKERFEIPYSDSQLRQVVNDLGSRKIICRPRLKKLNGHSQSNLSRKFKIFLNLNHLIITMMIVIFVWIQINKDGWQSKNDKKMLMSKK